MEFLVGATYCNRDGEYEVLKLNGNELTVRLEDGTIRTYDKRMQERIISNMEYEVRRLEPYENDIDNKRYFRTIGVLAAKSTLIEGFAPADAVSGFRHTYFQLTGLPLDQENNFYRHPPGTDKWGVELRIEFPNSLNVDEMIFGIGAPSLVPAPNGDFRINNNSFIKKLFELGFTFGTHQDIERIRNKIPSKYVGDFNAGCK